MTTRTLVFRLAALCVALLAGCGSEMQADGGPDASGLDGGVDAGFDAGPRPSATVEGDLHFVGCTPPATAVDVHLRPVRRFAAPSTDDAGAALPPTEMLRAVVSATADPQVLHFVADSLRAGDLAELGVDVNDPNCAGLAWRGPHGGLVMAGAPPVALDALAVRTRLEVLAHRPGGDTYVSRDLLGSGETTRHFRFASDLPEMNAVELQFATDRFDVDSLTAATACAPPAGLLQTTRALHRAGMPDELDVDLAPLLAAPPSGATELERVRWDEVVNRRAPLYVRAVPVGTAGRLCDPQTYGASSWVELVRIPDVTLPMPVSGPPVGLSGSYAWGAQPSLDAQLGATCYLAVHDHTLPSAFSMFPGTNDPLSWAMVFAGYHPYGYTVPAGESFCYYPPTGGSSSFLDDLASGFSDLAGGIIDFASFVVNTISSLYSEVRNAVVDLVAYALVSVGIGCPPLCHTVLQAAAEYALVALGLPPSLPNFDELADQGVDYLAAEIAEQTGVPPEVISQAYQIAQDMVSHAKETRGIPGISWVVEDTGFRPSTVTFDVRRQVSLDTPTTDLWVGGTSWAGTTGHLHLPVLPTDPPVRMPISLLPDYTGVAGPTPLIPANPVFHTPPYYGPPQRVESTFEENWILPFLSHSCVEIDAVGIHYVGILPVALVPYANMHRYNVVGTFSDPFGQVCTP